MAVEEVRRSSHDILKKKAKHGPGQDFAEEMLQHFFCNLRHNLVFDVGFRIKGLNVDHDNNCWCPW